MVRRLRPASRRTSARRTSVGLAPAGLALVAVLVAAACGGNEFAAEPPAPPTPSATTPPADPGPVKVTVQNAKDLTKRPFITVNRGALPAQLQTTDLVPGEGRTAAATDTVTVQYVGVIARNGQEFDASWDRDQPATFPLDQVIAGFRNGITGMKVGGRRQIIMPPEQAYGRQGSGSAIGPDETLIFVVDLISIK